jgi:phospholipid/cholesterol/gamma-HCH transport system permease protein
MILELVDYLGAHCIAWCALLGNYLLFLARVFKALFSQGLRMREFFFQMYVIGVESLLIIVLTGLCTGLALALQSYIALHRMGVDSLVSLVVGKGMTRELGPVLTALMIAGRCGSAMAAEIGTMQITEQIDALKTLCIDPYYFILAPRLVASILIIPCATLFAMVSGILGGFFLSTYVLAINQAAYISIFQEQVTMSDIFGGLFKSMIFGFIIASIGIYQGIRAHGGARGVGLATTKTVVAASVLILLSNYVLSLILFQIGVA